MTVGDWGSAGWLVVVLAGVAAVGGGGADEHAHVHEQVGREAGGSAEDAGGRLVPIRDYRRIASASSFADGLLLELAEPERVFAFSEGTRSDPERHRYGTGPSVSGPADLELLLAHGVDLLIVNHLGAEQELERVRAAGIAVFDLGEMRGLRTLERSMLALAELLGDRSRGERLWERTRRRMRAVAGGLAPEQRKSAIYLAIYAGKVFGGTRGTSYHDVLQAAGLHDLAAAQYRDWPQYDPEQLLLLDPPIVVTELGMGAELCANHWLGALQVCRDRGGTVLEMPSARIGDPGLRMLEAAEELHEKAYSPER